MVETPKTKRTSRMVMTRIVLMTIYLKCRYLWSQLYLHRMNVLFIQETVRIIVALIDSRDATNTRHFEGTTLTSQSKRMEERMHSWSCCYINDLTNYEQAAPTLSWPMTAAVVVDFVEDQTKQQNRQNMTWLLPRNTWSVRLQGRTLPDFKARSRLPRGYLHKLVEIKKEELKLPGDVNVSLKTIQSCQFTKSLNLMHPGTPSPLRDIDEIILPPGIQMARITQPMRPPEIIALVNLFHWGGPSRSAHNFRHDSFDWDPQGLPNTTIVIYHVETNEVCSLPL